MYVTNYNDQCIPILTMVTLDRFYCMFMYFTIQSIIKQNISLKNDSESYKTCFLLSVVINLCLYRFKHVKNSDGNICYY